MVPLAAWLLYTEMIQGCLSTYVSLIVKIKTIYIILNNFPRPANFIVVLKFLCFCHSRVCLPSLLLWLYCFLNQKCSVMIHDMHWNGRSLNFYCRTYITLRFTWLHVGEGCEVWSPFFLSFAPNLKRNNGWVWYLFASIWKIFKFSFMQIEFLFR